MDEAIILQRVQQIRIRQPRIGTRKLYQLLGDTFQQHGIKIGRDRLFDLLSDYGMLVRRRKRRKACTTDSNHPFRKYPNLIRNLAVVQANQLWVSDITYLALTGSRFCYLSLVTDVYSRKIVGYCLHPSLHSEGPVKALKMAFDTCPKSLTNNIIHHSDRGLQYCSKDYTDLLYNNNAVISMTEKGDPYENAIAERVNGILKSEFFLDRLFTSYEQAILAVSESIQTYNQLRPHSSCNYLTPDQAYSQKGKLLKKWKKRTKTICKPNIGLVSIPCKPMLGLQSITVNFKQD